MAAPGRARLELGKMPILLVQLESSLQVGKLPQHLGEVTFDYRPSFGQKVVSRE